MVHAASSASAAEQGRETEEEEEEYGTTMRCCCDDEGKPRPRRRGTGTARSINVPAARGSEELVPWLSWKVFDVIFALAVLWLAKRVKFVRERRA